MWFCGKIGLLLWKNLTLRRRHWCLTICEIIIPTLIFFFLVYFNWQVDGGISIGQGEYLRKSGANYSEIVKEKRRREEDNGRLGRQGSSGNRDSTQLETELKQSIISLLGKNATNVIGFAPAYSGAAERIRLKFKEEVERYRDNTTAGDFNITFGKFSTEKKMESFFQSSLVDKHFFGRQQFLFGIVFEKGLSGENVEKEVSYKIRPNWGLNTSVLKRNGSFPKDFDISKEYQMSGVLGAQFILDRILIEEMTSNFSEADEKINLNSILIVLHQFPIPRDLIEVDSGTRRDEDNDALYSAWMNLKGGKGKDPKLLSIVLAMMTALSFLFMVPTLVREIVSEKETGIRELMKMCGLPSWMQYFGWLLNTLCILPLTITIIMFLWCYALTDDLLITGIVCLADKFLIWIVLFLYGVWTTTFCFVISSFFENPALATTYGILIWLITAGGIATGTEHYLKDYSVGAKLLFCLVPNVAIQLACSTIMQWENEGTGAQWSNLYQEIDKVNQVPLGYTLFMMVFTSVLNILFCFYVEAIMPRKFGVRKDPWFLFRASEWDCKKQSRVTPMAPINAQEEKRAEITPESESKPYDEKTQENQKDSTGQAPDKPQEMAVSPPFLSAYETGPGFEDEPKGIHPGVQIQHLTKQFGEKIAVNNLSVNMFEGEIFCLLGENGAGKTTTMSILTGLLSPTSGTAMISGYDIHTGMDKIRNSLGLCPQHNMLFERLTVMEHLKFFGVLKGLKSSQAVQEGQTLLGILKIQDKAKVMSMKLSGGQKRKLQLGCALIGNSRILFLDEPSSGMDPEARRAIWDILLDYRVGKTIILSTHFMEEADVLGDRIGIMSSGKLQCCGSPSFLKKYYGAGFTLNMTIKEGADKEKILKTVEKHVPGAHIKQSHSNSTTEVSFVLPTESNTSAFPALFKDLQSRKDELKIEEMGMGWTSMDDVFIKVEELAHPPPPDEEVEKDTDTEVKATAPISSITKEESQVETEKPPGAGSEPDPEQQEKKMNTTTFQSNPLVLSCKQFLGLLIKNVLVTYRRRRFVISQIILPLLLTLGVVLLGSSFLDTPEDQTKSKSPADLKPALKLTLDSYPDSITPFYYSPSTSVGVSTNSSIFTEEIGLAYSNVLGTHSKLNLTRGTIPGETLPTIEHQLNTGNLADIEKYIVGADIQWNQDEEKVVRDSYGSWRIIKKPAKYNFNGTLLTGWYSPFAFHSAPLTVNLLSNALLQAKMNGDVSYKIEATIHPLSPKDKGLDLLRIEKYPTRINYYSGYVGAAFAASVAFLLAIVMFLFVTSFVTEPAEERLNQGKQLQMMTGVSPVQYFGSLFLTDLLLCILTISLMIAIIAALESDNVFSNRNGIGILFLILITFCLPALLFSYIYSTCVKSSSEGFRRIICTHLFTGFALAAISVPFEVYLGYQSILIPLNIFGRLFPGFGFTRALMNYAFTSFKNLDCDVIPKAYLEIICHSEFDMSTYGRILDSYDHSDVGGSYFTKTKLMRCCGGCRKQYQHIYDCIEKAKKLEELGAQQGVPTFYGGPRVRCEQRYPPCSEDIPFFLWNVERKIDHSMKTFMSLKDQYSSKSIIVPGLAQDIIWLIVLFIIYAVFLMLIEYGIIWKPKNPLGKEIIPPVTVEDEDVLKEADRVKGLVEGGMTDEDAIVIHNLSKAFDDFWAVSSLSFGVHFGECFGLLGVNGAGKTTSFRMLTGDETVTFGEAFMGSLALKKGRKQFMSKIGYCPQFDGINEVLTGKEMLCLYARLRGIWGPQINMEADKWLKKTGLHESGDIQCGKYSGGMKRRLSTAIALIADPPVIFLDEPTSGVDPVSRRQFWKIIASLKNSGQAIVLTSHSMEECEAICNRLGIMVNGEMQCFGGVQHLKNKYAQGYSMTVKLNPEIVVRKEKEASSATAVDTSSEGNESIPKEENPESSQSTPPPPETDQQTQLPEQHSKVTQYVENPEIEEVIKAILDTFNCELKDRHMGTLKFQIYEAEGKAPLTWDELYGRMEKTKEKLKPKIEEYAIFETTLEEVFLAFAKMQYDHERPELKGRCRCCRSCCCC